MTVVEYEMRFNELSSYAIEFISTETNRAKRFEQGLRSVIRECWWLSRFGTMGIL